MTRKLLPVLTAALALAVPTTVGLATAAEAAAPRCGGVKATIVGSNKSERIVGTPRRDVIVARGGNDRIDGRGGTDIICGGAGNDTIVSGPGAGGLLYGDGGRDTLVAEAGGIGLLGGAGNDTLRSQYDDVLFEGGAGNDTITGSPYPDVIDGGSGNDRIDAAGGADKYVTGGPGNDVVDGGPGTDVLRGGPGDDTIALGAGAGGFGYGEEGNDAMATGADGQALYGGPGADLLKTAWASSLLEGQAGDDKLYGGTSADTINGGDGNDRISGGAGDDIALNGGFGTDTCDGGPGSDRCHGGAPGGPANSPTDPDLCTAEVTVSCRGDEFPDRWLATVEGVVRTDTETRTWTVKMVLVRRGDPATTSFWREESVSGSFAVTGRDDHCSWSHSGAFTRDYTGDLGLVPAEDLYWLDVVATGDGELVRTCDNGGGYRGEESFQAWAATEGGPDPVPWDRSRREITGSWVEDGTYEDVDIDWVITPLA